MSRFSTAVLFAIAAIAFPASGEETADKPDLRVGDYWVFAETGSDFGRAVDRRWSRYIAEMFPDDTFRVEPRYNRIDKFDTSWNERHPDRPNFVTLHFQFPLRVGAEWSFASPPASYDEMGRGYYFRGHFKVVAYESITVPAGTFDCFRIEGATHWMGNPEMLYPRFKVTDSWYMTRWYCPKVKYVAKWHVDNQTSGDVVGLVRSIFDSELISYGHYNVPPPAPVPAIVEQNRYDGPWAVSLSCEAFGQSTARTQNFRITVRDGEFVLLSGTRGEPGYSRISGRPKDDGTLSLDGSSFSRSSESPGREYRAHFEGSLDGDRFRLMGSYGDVGCAMLLVRAGG